ncbi:TlpA disulfide reductase family protein [Microscilla marina]|uniref:Lipoprotein, putative n=1 Tax=Microscilla marina ATCC 23134 TaxID=313606 RepID=A1ZKC6_MICM2|nr:TlpA disulfide reductase family protein [Microscilla marina]EAY29152.1 lipoprotein, putative [Microscilla marina ATCC 23134]
MKKIFPQFSLALYTFLLLFFVSACKQPTSENKQTQKTPLLTAGMWRATIQTPGGKLPFQLDIKKNEENQQYTAHIINGEERILLDEFEFVKPDSVKITLHVFDAYLTGKIIDGRRIKGLWIKNGLKKPYEVAFEAEHGKNYRFAPVADANQPLVDFNGRWQVEFTKKDGSTYPAIGIFKQQKRKVTGTFMTTTGDYRYLEGQVNQAGELQISAFDGNHAFLFQATQQGDSLKGQFWHGKSVYESWTGIKNAQAKLPDANRLTYLKPGHDKLAFSFPDMLGKKVSLNDPKFKNKVVLVQIFGTWCPNCLDETAFLAPWYDKNKSRGVEIIGLAYERSPEFAKAKKRIEKMIKRYNIGYDFLFAGHNDKKEAAKTLPMLNHILSFPTTIFIDRQGKVRKIHTGFNGPGTGKYYEDFKRDFKQTMDELIAEGKSQ